jgi:methylmalonyl-CoA mutase cobalamin-binding domain/chain
MKSNNLEDVLFITGGVIPPGDIVKLEELGVDAVFPANTMTKEITKFFDQHFKKEEKY